MAIEHPENDSTIETLPQLNELIGSIVDCQYYISRMRSALVPERQKEFDSLAANFFETSNNLLIVLHTYSHDDLPGFVTQPIPEDVPPGA